VISVLKTAFRIAGFTFTVAIPILMFGGIIPYTHEGKAAGFTTMGYLALVVFVIILAAKLRSRLKERPESLARGVLLALFPLGAWAVIRIGLDKIVALATNISEYWGSVLVFLLIGCMFYVGAEAIGEKEKNK
jgi:hypothetical protein